VSVNHYENFPVASLLCPPHIRPAVAAIYAFARTADDIADEGNETALQRLDSLADYRRDLEAAAAGRAPSARWKSVFDSLARAMTQFGLPLPLLSALLSAFEQDVVKHDYADRAELLDYCSRSANPVGRLLLHLYGIRDERSIARSDAICTALQLANFWQDLSVDLPRGRIYLPRSDCLRYGVTADLLLARQDSPQARAVIADAVEWARLLMLQGAPLVHCVVGRAGWELRLVVQGGLRILEKIERMKFATLRIRPVLRWHDAALLLWRGAGMRPRARRAIGETA